MQEESIAEAQQGSRRNSTAAQPLAPLPSYGCGAPLAGKWLLWKDACPQAGVRERNRTEGAALGAQQEEQRNGEAFCPSGRNGRI